MCEPMRKYRLVTDVANGLPNKFLTLTTRFVEGGDPVAEARRQGEAFTILVRRIRKRWPSCKFAFFAVREATNKGWPHLHVALRSPWIDQVWLSEQWKELTGSFVVDIRVVRQVGNVAKYLAKYIGKSPQRFGTTKRYWSSRNWNDVKRSLERPRGDWNSDWFICRDTICRLAENYFLRGWEVSMEGRHGYFEARAPP